MLQRAREFENAVDQVDACETPVPDPGSRVCDHFQ